MRSSRSELADHKAVQFVPLSRENACQRHKLLGHFIGIQGLGFGGDLAIKSTSQIQHSLSLSPIDGWGTDLHQQRRSPNSGCTWLGVYHSSRIQLHHVCRQVELVCLEIDMPIGVVRKSFRTIRQRWHRARRSLRRHRISLHSRCESRPASGRVSWSLRCHYNMFSHIRPSHMHGGSRNQDQY